MQHSMPSEPLGRLFIKSLKTVTLPDIERLEKHMMIIEGNVHHRRNFFERRTDYVIKNRSGKRSRQHGIPPRIAKTPRFGFLINAGPKIILALPPAADLADAENKRMIGDIKIETAGNIPAIADDQGLGSLAVPHRHSNFFNRIGAEFHAMQASGGVPTRKRDPVMLPCCRSLDFYIPDHPFVFCIGQICGGRQSQYDIWPGIDQKTKSGRLRYAGRNAVLTGSYSGPIFNHVIRPAFKKVSPMMHIPLYYHHVLFKTLNVWKCYGFKGFDEKAAQRF